MRNTNKKGFTIVELVIVVAVIAILAAVLIPTFSGIIAKARLTVDQSAVTNMNKVLATEECATVSDAIVLLDKNGMDLEDYKPLSSDHYFYFVNGQIILADKNDTVVYPKNANANGQWMSLSGEVPMDNNYTVADNGAVTIDSGAKLVHLMSTVADGGLATNNSLNIKLSGDIDLKGTTVNFGIVSKNITLDGSNATISGIRADSNSFVSVHEGEDKAYGYSLFGKIESGKTLIVKDITISNTIIKDTSDGQSGHAGIIAGSVYGTLKVENVTIDNCAVFGSDKAGIIAGYLSGANASITLNNVKATNSSVSADWFVARAVGAIDYDSSISITNCDFAGVTVSLREDASTYESQGRKVNTDEAGNKYLCMDESLIAYGLTANANYWRGKISTGSVTFNGKTYNTYIPMNDSWNVD